MADKPPIKVDLADVLDRRNESRRYMQINYWDEWEEVYRSSKCLTKKIMVTAKDGSQIEDTTRTNVCMPETSLIKRRKTARLTANPPQINYSSDSSPEISDKLTAWAFQQFDRSGEVQQHRKLVQSGVTFGFSVSKLYWDVLTVNRKFTRSFVQRGETAPYRDRASVMKLMGATPDEIQGSLGENGTELNDQELSQAIARFGNTVQVPQELTKYEGPCAKWIFIGDFFMEPGAPTLNESGWAVENYWETDLWLKKMAQRTYIDPESGAEVPIFDKKAVADLFDMGSWNPNQGTQQPYDLRTRFRTSVLGQQVPLFPVKLIPGKRFDILEHHARDEDGQMWITWIGNEKFVLGSMPYPWDLYGKYVYTEFVPLFDELSAYGDSTPRLLRFLQSLHNATVGARKDLVGNILRPMVLRKALADIPDELTDRKLFKEIVVKDLDSFRLLFENMSPISAAIQGAGEEEAQIMRMMALAEPNLTNVETGTDSNPQAGKTATTAVLAAKSADALTQFELDSLNWYLKEQGEKKLWMLQQQEADEPYQIGQKYVNKVEALSNRYGKTARVTLDQLEIQDEFEVEPAAMSMLSVDDDIRRQSALQMMQAASQQPGVWDPHYVARFFASTIRGVDPDKAVPPPQPPPNPPPKVSMTIAAKWPELPADVQEQILTAGGVQMTPEISEELGHDDTLRGIVKLDQAGTAADNLLSTAPSEQPKDTEPETNLSRQA